MTDFRQQIGRRFRQARATTAREGVSGLVQRGRRFVSDWIDPKARPFPVAHSEVIAATIVPPVPAARRELGPDGKMSIDWVMSPPGKGSGGHTTIFRVVKYLENKGHRNRVFFHDVYNADHLYFKSIVKDYFGFSGPVEALDQRTSESDAIFATSWSTVYPMVARRPAAAQFYFVQDFEPYFHPAGAESVLAEHTYKMPLHAVTAGRWLAEKLRAEYGAIADHFDFGCDTRIYTLTNPAARDGVVFYAKRDTPRRGFELGAIALEIFTKRNPDVPIHIYGDHGSKLPFPVIDHGVVRPADLCAIYNECAAGLTLSFTNVSLVPHEMLSSGCIPVVNDAENNRAVLDNPYVRYAPPMPNDLALALEETVRSPDRAALSLAASRSVTGKSWDAAAETVEGILLKALRR